MRALASGISSSELRKAMTVKRKIEHLEEELGKVLGGSYNGNGFKHQSNRNSMSRAGRARISAAQKKRWTEWHKKYGE